jgi:hypothetical protein
MQDPVTIGAHNLQIPQRRFGASHQFRERALVMPPSNSGTQFA